MLQTAASQPHGRVTPKQNQLFVCGSSTSNARKNRTLPYLRKKFTSFHSAQFAANRLNLILSAKLNVYMTRAKYF